MNENREKFRYILQFFFDKGKNAAQARDEICKVYGEEAISEATARFWFRRFKLGNFDVKDAPRAGRPNVENADEIFQRVEEDRHASSVAIAKELNIHHKTVLNYLNKSGYTKKHDTWVPNELTAENQAERVAYCKTQQNRNEVEPFLKRLIVGGEKWITYSNNNSRKRSLEKQEESTSVWAPKKVLLCIWWDWKGILYYELLSTGTVNDSELHCQQLEKLKQTIKEKRPELLQGNDSIVYAYDNAELTASMRVQESLNAFNWEYLIQPACSPDLSPTSYHLFPSLQSSLNAVKLTSVDDCKNYLKQHFAKKTEEFCRDGIMALPTRWQKIIEKTGAHIA